MRAVVVTAVFAAVGCSGASDAESDPAVTRGRSVYKSVCVACHAADPSQPGSLGPAIADSSRELLEARVIHGTYPKGYTPKRPGNEMPEFPTLAGSIDDLAAYLANTKAGN
jgi:mono/diheme cytochrome c family protein